MTPDQRIEYVRAVLYEFAQVHGKKRTPSNVEWALARQWAEEGIPLPTVLQAVRETTGKPATLHACERAVRENAARQAQAVPHPLLEPISMEGWAPEPEWSEQRIADEKAKIMKRHGRT